jgi:hypothetical protein
LDDAGIPTKSGIDATWIEMKKVPLGPFFVFVLKW